MRVRAHVFNIDASGCENNLNRVIILCVHIFCGTTDTHIHLLAFTVADCGGGGSGIAHKPTSRKQQKTKKREKYLK